MIDQVLGLITRRLDGVFLNFKNAQKALKLYVLEI